MRIWSLHPKYLDAKGMVALWRETLLAKHVLEGKTKGYTNHPQLNRFKAFSQPLNAVNYYLSEVHKEALRRNYNFDSSKFGSFTSCEIPVTEGQMHYEFEHLKNKLSVRDPKKLDEIEKLKTLEPHPLFKVVSGEVEDWERL